MDVAPATTPILAPQTGRVIASQAINQTGTALPGGGVIMRWTDREIRLVDRKNDAPMLYASRSSAYRAARRMSSAQHPGYAVLQAGTGYELCRLRSVSHTWMAVSADAPFPPRTTLQSRSNVPFAAGSVHRGATDTIARVVEPKLVAIIDGARLLRPVAGQFATQLREVPARRTK